MDLGLLQYLYQKELHKSCHRELRIKCYKGLRYTSGISWGVSFMNRTGDARGTREAMAPPSFCTGKSKKGNKEKKERVSKQALIIGCHQGQNVTGLAILERLVSNFHATF